MKTLRFIYAFVAAVAFMSVTACTDDPLEYGPDGYPEGETTVMMELNLDSFVENNVATRATQFPAGSKAGTVGQSDCNAIPDLVLVAYDADGNLLSGFPMQITKESHGLAIRDENRTPGDASNGKTEQLKTQRATFSIKDMPYGKYYIYAVANLRDENGNLNTLGELQKHSEELKTRDSFVQIRRDYVEGVPARNCEMFGYFAVGKSSESPGSEVNTEEQAVEIDRPGLTLHSWLRRACAIVSIDFDGSALRDNIKVYIKRATIHNLPKSVMLGKKSFVESADGMYPYRDANGRPEGNDQWIEYSSGSEETSWNYVSNGHPRLTDGVNGKELDLHGQSARCFYVYENMQGYGDDAQQKPQEPDSNGLVKDSKEKYDNKEYGTYIEVEGYYDLSSNTSVSRGPIRYRFMLGKDALSSFDVERNYHYKITMKLRGNGNDVDWHVDYVEKDGWEVRNPYYVSYLYNHDSTLRFRYTPSDNEEITSLDAEIVGNNWWPDQDMTFAPATREKQFPVTGATNAELMANPNKYKDKFGRNNYTSGTLKGRGKYLGNGFLSLRPTEKTNVTFSDTKSSDDESTGFSYSKTEHEYVNDGYFYGTAPNSGGVDRGKQSYTFDGSTTGGTGREQYSMVKDPVGNGVTFNIPVFTRAKVLVKMSAHTGNNPFAGSTRSAYVKLTVHLKNKTTGAVSSNSEVVRVEQVKRIVNPKAVYRRARNHENFHVVLKELADENSTAFTDVESDGPWMAEVLGDANFININGRQTIKGNGKIDFTIRFNKMNRDDKVRNAVVRIRYNNYSCVHLIFVRQGYDPVEIGGTSWRTFNMIATNKEAEDPRDEGSLFKFGNMSVGIDVASNYMPFVNLNAASFTSQNKTLYTSDDNGSYGTSRTIAWGATTFQPDAGGFKNHNVATMQDFHNIYYDPKNVIQQGFGVLYADGATETASTVEEAYGYCRHDAASVRNKRGMRGVVVYYWDRSNQSDSRNYKSVFFPIGRSGFGHRKDVDDARQSTLRYAAAKRNTNFPYTLTGPLLYNAYIGSGAIYYSRYKVYGMQPSDGGKPEDANSIGLDMNYVSFDFNTITEGNVAYGADACFIRCVGSSFK